MFIFCFLCVFVFVILVGGWTVSRKWDVRNAFLGGAGISLEHDCFVRGREIFASASSMALKTLIYSIFSKPGSYFFCCYTDEVVAFEAGASPLALGVCLLVPFVLGWGHPTLSFPQLH